jgi:hypothetical protein
MFTARQIEFINYYTINHPNKERYPQVAIYVSKGQFAFNLHSRLISLSNDWLESFTEAEKEECFLLVTVMITISKAVQKNPDLIPKSPRRKIRLYFNIKDQVIPSSESFTSNRGQKLFKILSDEPNNLL